MLDADQIGQHYKNLSGDSGATHYAIGPTFIWVWFRDGRAYEYTYDRPGKLHVEEVKRLAKAGRGLATYINQHVRGNYARKS